MKGNIFCIVLLLCVCILNVNIVAMENPNIGAEASIVIDAEDGSVLYSENEEEILGIASITKLMTVFVAFEEIEKKNMKLTDVSYMSEKASAIKFQAEDVSGFYFTEGQKITNDQLIKLGLIFSDNGAMVQLAEVVSGSEENHVKLMNEKAKSWGLENTKFVNVTGLTMSDYGDYMLDGSTGKEYNVSSAIELSKMAFNMLNERPELLEITSQDQYEFNGETIYNWNMMLPGRDNEYKGVKGLKTGSSIEAGYCFTSYYSKGENDNYITVVLNSETSNSRFTDTAVLLDWVSTQEFSQVLDTNEKIPVKIGANEVDLYPKYGITSSDNFLLNGYISGFEYNSKFFNEDNQLIADIPIGETVGEMKIQKIDSKITSNVFSDGDILSIPLASDIEIKKKSKIFNYGNDIKNFFKDYIQK